MKNKLTRRVIVLITILTMLVYIPVVSVHAEGGSEGKSVEQMVKEMSTRDKVTQCLMVDFRKWAEDGGDATDMTVLQQGVAERLADYKFGAVILFAENIKKTEDTLRLTKAMQAAATSKSGQPLLIATDQEGGRVFRLGSGTALPGNMALTATGKAANATTAGKIIGRELQSLGINTTLAPVIDVNNNPNNPVIGLRSFSDDPDVVGEYGSKYIQGLNGYNTIGCAKHFPGHGDTATDSHTGLPLVDKTKEELWKTELKPFNIAINQGIDMIMTAHILYPKLDDTTILSEKDGKQKNRPATLSSKILTDLLRNEMKFNGVVVTDAMNMQGIADDFTMRQATTEALKAGADMVCMPVTGHYGSDWTKEMDKVIDYAVDAVNKDELPEARLNQAVTRILTLKQKKGILDYNPDQYTEAKAAATVGSAENRKLEREISAQAVTAIQNKNKTLPLEVTGKTKVLMMAPYENELAQMVMGLNRAKKAGLVPESMEVDVYGYNAEDYQVQGDLKEMLDWADVVIMNSEITRASTMTGEHWTSAGPLSYVAYCKEKGKTSVVISVDKPYDVQIYQDADAVLAAYGNKPSDVKINNKLLRGDVTESKNACGPNIIAGVEVAFGVFGASGKLPVNIPLLDKSTKSFTDQVKYQRGYGLKYSKRTPKKPIKLRKLKITTTSYTYNGKARKPAIEVRDQNNKKVSKSGYTVKYSNNKKVGAAKVVVTGKGNYTGKLNGSFKIVPGKGSIKSLKSGKRKLKVQMTKVPSKLGASHFQIAYKVKSAKSWKYKKISVSATTIKNLKKKKKYQVKVRAYKVVSGKTYYGAWSKGMTSKKVK